MAFRIICFSLGAVQKCAHLVDVEECYTISILYCQYLLEHARYVTDTHTCRQEFAALAEGAPSCYLNVMRWRSFQAGGKVAHSSLGLFSATST